MKGYEVYRFTHEGYLDKVLTTTNIDQAHKEYHALLEDGENVHLRVVDMDEEEFEEII